MSGFQTGGEKGRKSDAAGDLRNERRSAEQEEQGKSDESRK